VELVELPANGTSTNWGLVNAHVQSDAKGAH
jgi:hypothetical protein